MTCLVALLVIAPIPSFASSPSPGDDSLWRKPFPGDGPNQYVDAIVTRGDEVFVSGKFVHIGSMSVNYIARFDGMRWTHVGTGLGTPGMGLVHTLALDGNRLYAGGMFDEAGPIAAHNVAVYDLITATWAPLGAGTDRAVRGICVAKNGDVFIAGEFTRAGTVPSQGVARFDGSAWHALAGSLNRRARAMTVLASPAGGVYVAGFFTTAGGVTCNNIAYWDGTAFRSLDGGTDQLVTALALHDGQLYAGGSFTLAGARTARGIARWDGRQWHALGPGLSGAGGVGVRAITFLGSYLYVGGAFRFAGTVAANNIARWNGAHWEALGSGVNDQVKVITPVAGGMLIWGNFFAAGAMSAPYLAGWGPMRAPAAATPDVALYQNEPNPFNPQTIIRYSVPVLSRVRLMVFDGGGHAVRALVDKIVGPGSHAVIWDGRDGAGVRVSTGMYFYRLETGGKSVTRKMVVLK